VADSPENTKDARDGQGSQVDWIEMCQAGLRGARAVLPELLAAPAGSPEALRLYHEILVHVDSAASASSLLRSVHPEETVREAARESERQVRAFVSELERNRQVFEALAALDCSGMDPETRRFVEHALRDFRRAGVDRDEATRARLKEIDAELVRLGQEFSRNIVEDTRHITLDGPAGLAGLPQDYIDGHPPDASGQIRITTDYPDYIPFMSYAHSTELRRRLYIENRSRGGERNEAVLRDILRLRREMAALLGYPHWADYATEDKMMRSAAQAAEFIARVVEIARPRGERDYAELLARKRRVEPGAPVVQDYEKTYLENQIKVENYACDPQLVRAYFPYEQVEKGVLGTTERMYGIRYQHNTEVPVWHEEVKAFDVLRGAALIGRIYLDMHPREGKYKHAAQFTLRSGVLDRQVPEGVLVCNFPGSRGAAGPALMEHGDVVTMFHEFGHLMHHILGGRRRWIAQSGVATEWDFVEAPSQMFEEWAWNHESLRAFARHWETGEEISPALVERMRAADRFGVGLQALQQMYYASLSLQFHTVDPDRLDMLQTVRDLQVRYVPFPYVEGTRFHASFGHLYGYSALYYTYMWSLVIAKDLLTPFRDQGLTSLEVARRYCDMVLAPGGSRDAAELVRDFLGRDFRFDAFEAHLTGTA
jgi:thimet oligopeptidase